MGNLLGSPITDKDTHVGTTHDSNPDANTSPDGGGLQYGISSMQGWRIHMEDAHIAQPFLYAEKLSSANNTDDGSEEDAEKRSNTSSASDLETPCKKMAIEVTPKEEGSGGGIDNVNVQQQTQTSSITSTTKNDSIKVSSDQKYIRIPLPNHALFAVFDGHGGSFAAEYSSRNLLRVLCRSEGFCAYAEKWRGREQFLKDEREKLGLKDEDEAESNTDYQYARATYDHELMTLLEKSLRDAFCDIDVEILKEVRGEKVDDANLAYGAGYDLSMHSLEECVGHLPKEAEVGVTFGTSEAEDKADSATDKEKDTSDAHDNGDDHPTPSDDEDAGTTAVLVLTTPKWIVCANAGDSRAVYARSNHRAVPLSYDHKPEDEDEERRIREAGGYVSGGRVEGDLAVSRGLGDYRFKDLDAVMSGSRGENIKRSTTVLQRQIADTLAQQRQGGDSANSEDDVPMLRPSEQKVSPLPDIIVQNRDPKEDEFIIIACDGIWDVQTNQECVRMVADIFAEGEDDMGLVCEEILDQCLIKGSKDNMTASVIKFPKQTIGKGGGVTARRERRGAAGNGNGGGGGAKEAAGPYVPPALRDGESEESKGDDDDDQ